MRRVRSKAHRVLVASVCAVLTATLLYVPPAVAAQPESATGLAPQAEPVGTTGISVHGVPSPVRKQIIARPKPPAWPPAATAQVTLPSAGHRGETPVRVRAGGLPVWVERRAGDLDDVSVSLLGRDMLPSRWRDGVVLRVGGTAGRSGTANLTVAYGQFRTAFGGDWASRLRLWQLPECALTTPEAAACQATALPSANEAGQVTAVAPIASRATTLVALSAGPEGPGGSFTESSMSPSATWSTGGSSGEFIWSYGLRTPPAAGGQAPRVTVSYSSGTVDGRSQATNNQPGWIGEGFNFWPGAIERSYVACADDMGGNANNTVRTGDRCWRSDNAVMAFSGGGELIYEAGKGWHSRNDSGMRIEKLTGAANGDNDGEYWKVTAPDGTQYYFGLNRPAGQPADTNSTWYAPVYGNNTGEPCRAASFAASRCNQAYRWNLDYVIDPSGNTTSYWYDQELNKYAANMTATDDVSYVRGGTLNHIDYGTWDRGSGDRSVSPTAQILFATGDRCLTNCATHSDNWPDVPWDQECAATATSCPNQFSPTFWSTKRLSTVTTKVWDTTAVPAAWQNVDSWTLTHSFPPTGDNTHPGLWLSSIVHAGLVGTTAATMPPVTFEPVSMANRVLTATGLTNNWQRLSNVISETGAKTHVTYSLPDCTSSSLPTPETNNRRCYPVLVPNPDNPSGTPLTQWWHKYVVEQVAEVDLQLAGGHQSPTVNTYYQYLDGPAWHYADEDGLTQQKYKTWNGYRGYGTVKVRKGDGLQSLTETRYLRGMHGDRLNAAGGTRVVTVAASLGSETVYDEDRFAGLEREIITYQSTQAIAKSVSVPWSSAPTATRTIGDTTVSARFAGIKAAYQATSLGLTGELGWRTTKTTRTFDDTYGTLSSEQADGGTAAGDEQCVTHTYNRNVAANLVQSPKRTLTTAVACGTAVASTDDIISDDRYYYDGAASVDTAPTKGLVTKRERLQAWTPGGGSQYQVTHELTYDTTGRVNTVKDVRGNVTTTAYTPAVGGPLTLVTMTTQAPYSWTKKANINPYWGSATTLTDVNGRRQDAVYDQLGRVSKVWNVGWRKADHPTTPSVEYTYAISPTRDDYPSTTTRTLDAKGNYQLTYQIVDGLMRKRQTQRAAIGVAGRVITDTLYDDQGRVATTYPAHAETGAPGGTLWWDAEWTLRAVNHTEYDAASRTVAEVFLAGNGTVNLTEKWRTTTAYAGDRVLVTPPAGGVPTTTVTDVRGRTVELRHHKTAAGVNGDFDTTTYSYNRKGEQVKVTDTGLDQWTWKYDVRKRLVESKDPDRGTIAFVYNEFDDLVKTTDARNEVLVYEYDQLGRKKAVYDDAIDPNKIRSRLKYDSLYSGVPVKGQLTEAYRYEPAGSANIYKWQVRGFSPQYAPTGVNYVIPEAEGALAGTHVLSYGYSAYTGTPTSITYPGVGGLATETVTTGFDSVTGLPSSLTTNLPTVASYVTGQDYSPFGEPTMTTTKVGGGVYVQNATEYELDTRRVHRLTVKPETATGKIADLVFDYDPAGNVKSLADTPEVGPADTQCFRYDPLWRLSSAWTPKATVTCATDPAVGNLGGAAPYWQDWTFDLLGNRATETTHTSAGNTTRTYALPTPGATAIRPHAATSVTATAPAMAAVVSTFGYNAAGSTTTRTSGSTQDQSFVWDSEGHQQSATAGGVTTTSVYDASGTRLVRRDGTGPTPVRTLYLPGQELRADAAGTLTATRYYAFAGSIVASRTGSTGALTWLIGDQQGTQQISVDAATQVVTRRRQTPYGQLRGAAVTWPNNKGFVGGDKDPTGITRIGARDYDPVDGRFLSADPILDVSRPMSMQAYGYADGKPTTLADPTGMDPCIGGGGGCWHLSPEQEAESKTRPEPPYVSTSAKKSFFQSNGRGGSTYKTPLDFAPLPDCSHTGSSSWSSPAACNDAYDEYRQRKAKAKSAAAGCEQVDEDDRGRWCGGDVNVNCEEDWLGRSTCTYKANVTPPQGNRVITPPPPAPVKETEGGGEPFISISFCVGVCLGVTLSPSGLQGTAGGLGSVGYGMNIGVTSIPASEQAAWSGQLCAAVIVGSCVSGGMNEDLTEPWIGSSLQIGSGWFVGPPTVSICRALRSSLGGEGGGGSAAASSQPVRP